MINSVFKSAIVYSTIALGVEMAADCLKLSRSQNLAELSDDAPEAREAPGMSWNLGNVFAYARGLH